MLMAKFSYMVYLYTWDISLPIYIGIVNIFNPLYQEIGCFFIDYSSLMSLVRTGQRQLELRNTGLLYFPSNSDFP